MTIKLSNKSFSTVSKDMKTSVSPSPNIANTSGQAMILSVIVIMAVSLLIVTNLGALAVSNARAVTDIVTSMNSYYTAQSGMEDHLLRVTNPSYSYTATNSLALNGATTTIEVNTLLNNDIEIESTGIADNRVRKLKAVLTPRISSEASFFYGVQVGAGGLLMQNNTKIIGNVYSNGSITGVNNAEITGSAFAAGTSIISGFDAVGHGIKEDVHADHLANLLVGGDAYYQTKDTITVTGTEYPGTENLPAEDLPIPPAQVDTWKNDATLGGTISGNYLLDGSDTDTLGPKKIDGNMTIANSAVLTITGTVWVTGDITLQNNAVVELHDSYGEQTGVLMTSGTIFLKNNLKLCGSEGYNTATDTCNAANDSFILLLSTKVGGNGIEMQNGSALRGILYTSDAQLIIKNTAQLNEATGYGMELKNLAVVTYVSGLSSIGFKSGPGGTMSVTSLKEVE